LIFVPNLFCGLIFVPNLFCVGWSAKFILRWSAKFILRLLECKIYFASVGVQNLFCIGWSAKFILRVDFQTTDFNKQPQNEFAKWYTCKLKFALQQPETFFILPYNHTCLP